MEEHVFILLKKNLSCVSHELSQSIHSSPDKTALMITDLNQIPYNYTVEATNRFKGSDLIEHWENYGQRFATLYRRW